MLFYVYYIFNEQHHFGTLKDANVIRGLTLGSGQLDDYKWPVHRQDLDIRFAVQNRLYLAIHEVAE